MAKKEKKPKDAEAPPVDGEDGEGAQAPAKKKFPLLIVIIAAAVLLLGGGGAAAYFLFLAPKHPPAAAGAKDAHGDKKAEKKKDDKKGGHGAKDGAAAKVDPATQPVRSDGPNGTVYYTLPDTVANIQSPDGTASYLKLKLTFECADDSVADALDADLPRINDVLQGFMRELRPEDLSGSQGNYQLRLEILRRVNLVLAPQKINAVLIEQMLVT
ncbi:flagellar basal body-associated FliL family protein [Asticcacaulis sp. EMRT-3]|uniref:flagellar basal body-associated FliL family protein n=1 Tax=Asticcacaulis sp. EMRT-3 TaxID=3040349 RepID=UPI0024AFD56C|nr:flagellar basal body-associated FliL family protein [Asticcacaulis sp. EMRT-3]MDI7773800.1 flagellar basal body-associated FliL family protein [Asticcacaulis sp. EMRT-3]